MQRTTWIVSIIAALGLCTGLITASGENGDPCSNVSGQMELTVGEETATGTVSGDIEGDIEIVFGDVFAGNELSNVSLVFGSSTITTDDGDIMTKDLIATVPLGQSGLVLWSARHVIVEGTGDYEDALGGFATYGFYNTNNGSASLSYLGLICTAE